MASTETTLNSIESSPNSIESSPNSIESSSNSTKPSLTNMVKEGFPSDNLQMIIPNKINIQNVSYLTIKLKLITIMKNCT